jgi:hypothetical protein
VLGCHVRSRLTKCQHLIRPLANVRFFNTTLVLRAVPSDPVENVRREPSRVRHRTSWARCVRLPDGWSANKKLALGSDGFRITCIQETIWKLRLFFLVIGLAHPPADLAESILTCPLDRRSGLAPATNFPAQRFHRFFQLGQERGIEAVAGKASGNRILVN